MPHKPENHDEWAKNKKEKTAKQKIDKHMQVEIEDHQKRGHWHLFDRSKIPKGHKLILVIWSCKRNIYLTVPS